MNDEGSESTNRRGPRPVPPEAAERAAEPRRAYRPFLAAAVLLMLGLLATAGVKSYSDLSVARNEERHLLGEIAGGQG